MLNKKLPLSVTICTLNEEKNISHFQEWWFKQNLTLNYVIWGSSIGLKKTFEKSSTEQLEKIIKVNTMSLVQILKIVLPSLKKHNGRVFVFSSTAAFQPGPGNAVYFATKAFQKSLIEAIAYEYRSHGFKFLLLCAGPLIPKQDSVKGAFLRQQRTLKLEEVASSIETHFARNTLVWIPGVRNRFFRYLTHLLPKDFIHKRIWEMGQDNL
jgi:short-subunit dehydrogenase